MITSFRSLELVRFVSSIVFSLLVLVSDSRLGLHKIDLRVKLDLPVKLDLVVGLDLLLRVDLLPARINLLVKLELPVSVDSLGAAMPKTDFLSGGFFGLNCGSGVVLTSGECSGCTLSNHQSNCSLRNKIIKMKLFCLCYFLKLERCIILFDIMSVPLFRDKKITKI